MITLEFVKTNLNYNPITGIFTWLKPAGRCKLGTRAGNVSIIGYRRIRLRGLLIYEHRLAWFYMTGEWPNEIDHIDLDRSNNKWSNLRKASTSENACNRKPYSSRPKGVKRVGKKNYIANITKDGLTRRLGKFKTKKEAVEAYRLAAVELHGEFRRFK